jgi:DNA-binding CsgD family transcriptional regulator
LALARQATRESGIHGPDWLARSALWFEDEYENLLQALSEDSYGSDPDIVPELLDALYRYWMYRGLFDQGLSIVERFDPDQFSIRGRALYLQSAGGLRGHVESLTNVRAVLAESVQLWREVGDDRGLATALTRLASSLLETDGFAPCRDALNEAMTLYASLGDKWMHARVLAMLGAAAASDPSEAVYARSCLETGASEMRNLGDPGAASLPMQQLGRLLIEEGDYEQAQSVLEHGMRQIREVDQVQVSAYLNLLGVVDASVGRHASAASRYLESLRIAVRLGLKSRAVWCLEGLAVTLGDLDERPLAAAAAACAQVIREDLGLEDWWMETCCPKRPGPHLPESMGSAARLALIEGEVWPPTVVLREAPRRLAELAESAAGAVPRVRSNRPDGLTARECEILALLAQGMTSRDVARNLVISIDTVGRHITNIYRKIGARGRADATAYALSMGIAVAPTDG